MTKTTELIRNYSEEPNVVFYSSKETGYSMRVELTKNDINGNPMYKFIFKREDMADKTNPHIIRRYLSKGYVLVQSFDLEGDIIDMMNHIEKGAK